MPPGFRMRRSSSRPLLVIGEVAESEGDGDQVERGAGQRQSERVGFE